MSPSHSRTRSIGFVLLALLLATAPAVVAQEGSYDWTQARNLHPGIRYARVEVSNPRKIVIHGMRIDSRTPELKFHSTPRRAEWVDGKTETDRQTTRNYLRKNRAASVPMVVAVNADAFSPWPAPYEEETPTDLLGLAVAGGSLVSRGSGTPSLIVTKSGELRIAVTQRDTDIDDIETAVSGFGLCLVDDQIAAGGNDLHPRTGIGLCREKRYVVVVALDGRQPDSAGATTSEVGVWLKHFGAANGINMDGGGSTTMAWWDPTAPGGDNCRLLNRPVGDGRNLSALPADQFTPTERANGNNFGVSLTAAAEEKPTSSKPHDLSVEGKGELVGITVTPHRIESSLRYRRPRDPSLAARVQLFVRGPAFPTTFAGTTPAQLLQENQWAWHDLNSAPRVPQGALSVWSFNGKDAAWGVGQAFELKADGLGTRSVAIAAPQRWISALTFLSDRDVRPDTIVVHIANESPQPLHVKSLRLWLPKDNASWPTLWPQEPMPAAVSIPPGDKGFVKLRSAPLPLTYGAFELSTDAGSLWAHLRIKRETFDISGGWIFDSRYPWTSREADENQGRSAFLDLLCHLHVNTAHFENMAGYSDQPEISKRYPLKRFHRLWPLEQWDTDEWLPKIHAVEFLGEPQYGGGRPVPPQEVFDKLLPYRTSRLATSVTHSEERIWRNYAGLSDYPHYDAYRVVAPAADAWREYDRWGGKRISWGAPLETIGDLCRSQRELNRPMPCAVWSQGPHHDWGGGFFGGGRARRSPTPDELRSQAIHALSTRITSLYWFNLSLKSLMKYPDTWEAMMRVGREIKMLAPFYLEGDAYRFERRASVDGTPDWDLASIAAPTAAVMFAIDTNYQPDPAENVFAFGEPRRATFAFALPSWLREPTDVFRVDADGIHAVTWRPDPQGIVIDDLASRDRIYVATRSLEARAEIERRRQAALDDERSYPINLPALEKLKPQ